MTAFLVFLFRFCFCSKISFKQPLWRSFIIHLGSFPPPIQTQLSLTLSLCFTQWAGESLNPSLWNQRQNIKEGPLPQWHHVVVGFDVQGPKWVGLGSQGANSKVRDRLKVHSWETNTIKIVRWRQNFLLGRTSWKRCFLTSPSRW